MEFWFYSFSVSSIRIYCFTTGFLLLLSCFSRWIGIVDCNKDYKVIGSNDTKSKSESGFSRSTALTATRAIVEVGETFQYGVIGELDKVKEVNGKKQVGIVMKKIPVIKHLPKLAGFFGGIGTMLWLAFSGVPQGESSEMKFMKEKFSEINSKLDGISNSVKHTKGIVKEYTQKSAYIRSENNIIIAYQKLKDGVEALLNLNCSEKKRCETTKKKMVNDYISQLNVRTDVDMVMRGAISRTVFSESLLELISEGSRCDVTKIKNFQSGVASLVAKGGAAAMFYDIVSKTKYDFTADLKQFQNVLLNLEKKKESVLAKCYKNIDRYISYDINDLGLNAVKSSVQETNKDVLKFLSVRYPWIPFYVITVKTNTYPYFWSEDSFGKNINRAENNKDNEIKSYILIGSNSRVENDVVKANTFRNVLQRKRLHNENWLQFEFDKSTSKLHDAVDGTAILYRELRTTLIVPEYDDIVVGYKEDDYVKQVRPKWYNEIKRRDLLVYQQCRHKLVCNGADKPVYVIATIKTVDFDSPECDKDCSSNGYCIFLPHTKVTKCKCDDNHYGEICNMSASDSKLALDLSKLMDITFKIPSLLDVSMQLHEVKVSLQSDIGNIRNAIQTMDKRLSVIFDSLGKELMTAFDWHGLITQYGQIVRDLKYYYHILIAKDNVCTNPSYVQLVQLKCDFQRKFVTKEKEDLANVILRPNELQRYLHYLNYLLMGRQDMSLISHRPLLFQTMDKHRKQICSTEYKHTIDKAYKQILLLQFQGYIVWVHSLKFLNRDTSFVVERYKDLIEKQKKFYDSNTCSVNIRNSINFENCMNGYYLYSGMKEEVKCRETFYITKDTSFGLHVSSVISVSSESSRNGLTADKIIGAPDEYPDDKDGGKAWSPAIDQIDGQQFIEVSFKDPLHINKIIIYEISHGGSVFKIEGLNKYSQWKTLWETVKSNLQDLDTRRNFSISIKTLTWSTSKLKVWVDPTVSGQAFQIDAIQIKGTPVQGTCTWYNSMVCSTCDCNGDGSSSLNCDSDGICTCKTGFYGKKCTDRDCLMEEWSSWSTCNCGPGQSQKRIRSKQLDAKGGGKSCGSNVETRHCFIRCVCGHEEWGDYCEHKHCLVSDWGSWAVCPHQRPTVCGYATAQTLYVKRTRYIMRRNQGAGRACPNLEEKRECPKPRCILIHLG